MDQGMPNVAGLSLLLSPTTNSPLQPPQCSFRPDKGTTTFRMERVDGDLYLITVSSRIFVSHYNEAVEDFVRIGVRGRAEAQLAATRHGTLSSRCRNFRCIVGDCLHCAGRGHSARRLHQLRLCARRAVGGRQQRVLQPAARHPRVPAQHGPYVRRLHALRSTARC